MYAWLWRHLPANLYAKLASSMALACVVAALLWFVVFPWAEPILPFDDAQIGRDPGAPGAPLEPDTGPAWHDPPGYDLTPSGGPRSPGDDHDIPYPTHTNNPAPAPSRSR